MFSRTPQPATPKEMSPTLGARPPAAVEGWVLWLALFALSGTLPSLWTKAFAYAPPAPDVAPVAPIFVLMVAHMVVRLRASVVGALATWPWVGLAVLAMLSTLWSVSPADTVRESLFLVIGVPYLAMAGALFSWRDIVARSWSVGAVLFALSLLLYVAVPSLGRMQDIYVGALTGPWFEKNATGQFGCWFAALSLAQAALRPARAPLMLMAYVAALAFIVLTQSTTALLAALALLPVFAWVGLMRRPRPISIPALWVTAAVAVPSVLFAFANAEELFALVGKSSTLTGRIPIWDALELYALDDRPTKGHGYGAYWSEDYNYGRRAFVYDALGFQARHAHNALLEMRLALGWAGAWLWIAALVQTLAVTLLRLRSSGGAYFALPFLLAAVLVSLVETSTTSLGNWGGALLVICLAKMTLMPKPADRRSGIGDLMRTLSPNEGGAVPHPSARAA